MKVQLKEKLKNNFIVIPTRARKILSDSSFKMLAYLIEVAGYDKPFTSYEKIAKELGKSENTVLKSIKELRKLEVLSSRGSRIDTVWTIDFAPFLNEKPSENEIIECLDDEVRLPSKNEVRLPSKNEVQIRNNINKKEKKIKEKKERFDFVQRVSSNLTNEQIDYILRELKIEGDVKVHPNDNYYYKVRGKLSSQGGVSLMLSYIILKSDNKKGDLLKLLNNPQGFCNEVTNKGF